MKQEKQTKRTEEFLNINGCLHNEKKKKQENNKKNEIMKEREWLGKIVQEREKETQKGYYFKVLCLLNRMN